MPHEDGVPLQKTRAPHSKLRRQGGRATVTVLPKNRAWPPVPHSWSGMDSRTMGPCPKPGTRCCGLGG